MLSRYYLLIVFILLIHISKAQTIFIPYTDSHITYEGRIKYNATAAELIWSGTSATINIKGTGISAILQDLDTANYYNVIIDNKVISRIHTDTTRRTYVLAQGLKNGSHQVKLFKLTEWDKGKTLFFGWEVPKGTHLLAPDAPAKRKIEFYGNSITCGYAIEDNRGKDSGNGYFENNYLTYAALTARHFKAQYSCIAKSGIGVTVSWFPLIMPEMYNRLDPTDSTSRWDFTRYTPDVVVIDLFQNDSWIIKLPNNAEFKHRYGTQPPDENALVKAYRDFVTTIRNKYPDAHIICTLGNMDATKENAPWPGYVQRAVTELKDAKIYAHFFPYKNTPGHPNVIAQQAMADDLIDFIKKTIKW